MVEVIKRKGIREKFDSEKIRKSIKKAFVDAGLSLKENKENIEYMTKNIVLLAKEKTEITSKKIRDTILRGLDTNKKKVSGAWRKFEQRYKKEKIDKGLDSK
jgi:transcriptional regulator NrdR family protein